MKLLPIQPIASQFFSCTLGQQLVGVWIRQLRTGLFMNVYNDSNLVVGGVICENRNRIIRADYLGFIGDFIFDDTQGADSPTYDGLGGRFKLYYLAPAEVSQLVAADVAA